MTKEEQRKRAQEYIDGILAINRKYGMGEGAPEDIYEDAVQRTENAFRSLVESPA